MNDVRWRPWPGRRWPGLTWRNDLALPAAVGVVQLAGSYLMAGYLHYQHNYVTGAGGAPHLQGHLTLSLVLHGSGHLTTLDWALVIIGPAALAARHRYPVAVAWFAFTPTLAPSPLWFCYLSLIIACFGAAARGHRWAAWTVIAAGYACSVWLAPFAWGRPAVPPGLALLLAAWLAVVMVAAEAARMRQERRVEAATARELDARHRASEERLRMARELHDVIGHNISLVNIQAGVGLDLMDTRPEQARAALAAVRAVSGQALDELRGMLCALREADEDAPRSPAPRLGRLPELISLTRAAGLAVTVSVSGAPRALPAAVDLAAYRIVQESLTNVARHAGPTAVTVQVAYGEHDLSIEVTDDGCPAGGYRAPVNGAGGPGTGIPGMRERAAALGGQLEAGPLPGRGFQVRARLPLGGAP